MDADVACGNQEAMDALYSEEDSDEEWMPFVDSAPDLPHSKNWDTSGFVSPFRGTPVDKISRIICHLNLTSSDVVYDLGCGDGRVLIECARASQCSGVGLDLNERLLERARKNSCRFQVDSRVRFQKADILDRSLDISSATIVFLYLLPEALSRLLPRLMEDTSKVSGRIRKIVSVRWPLPGLRASTEDLADNFYVYNVNEFQM